MAAEPSTESYGAAAWIRRTRPPGGPPGDPGGGPPGDGPPGDGPPGDPGDGPPGDGPPGRRSPPADRSRPGGRAGTGDVGHPNRRRVRRVARVCLVGVLAAGVSLALLLALTPSVADAPARVAAQAAAHHTDLEMTRLPPRLATAVLAVEDHRFYHHPGIDALALGRYAYGLLTGRDEGGATIELQLAKLLYTPNRDTVGTLLDRMGIALKFDQAFTKNQVLLMYLNTAYFGDGAYGAASAARAYFGRSVYRLDWQQAALLAGLLQAPVAYDPLIHPGMAKARRYHVLLRLRAVGALSPAQVARYNQAPLGVSGSAGAAGASAGETAARVP